MARQIYFRGEATPARVNVPQKLPDIAGATAAMNSRPSPATELVKSVADAGQKIAGAVVSIQERRMEGHIEDAWLEARQRYGEWQAEYNRTHQAADALDAQADYQKAWNSIAEDVTSRYGKKLEGGFHHLLARKLELGRLYADDDGAKYQAAQFRVWGENQEKLQLSNLDQMVRDSPYDEERLQMEKAEAVRAWRVRNPGQDSTVFERGLDTGIASGRIAGMMARRDFAGASAALEQHRRDLDPEKAARIGEKLAQEQALQAYEGNPLAGSVELMTKAGRERFGLSREAGAAVARQLSVLASYQRRAQREGYAVARRQAWDGINAEQDPVTRVRMIQDSPHLSEREKRRAMRAVEQGTPAEQQYDPQYVGDQYERIQAGESISKEELSDGEASHRLTPGTSKFLSTVQEIRKDPVWGGNFRHAADNLDTMVAQAAYGMSEADRRQAQLNARNALAVLHNEAKKKDVAGLANFYNERTLPEMCRMIARNAVGTVKDRVRRLDQQASQQGQDGASRQRQAKKQTAEAATVPGATDSAPAAKPKVAASRVRRALTNPRQMIGEHVEAKMGKRAGEEWEDLDYEFGSY